MRKIGISKEAKMWRPFSGKRKVSSTNGSGKTGYQHASWTLSYTIHKTSSRIYLRPKCKTYNYKTLRRKAYDSGFGKDFLNMTSRALATKVKIDKLNYI